MKLLNRVVVTYILDFLTSELYPKLLCLFLCIIHGKTYRNRSSELFHFALKNSLCGFYSKGNYTFSQFVRVKLTNNKIFVSLFCVLQFL